MSSRIRHLAALVLLVMLCISSVGCQSATRNVDAVRAYYHYEFTDAREALRGDAYRRNDEQVLLNNLRLGMASLADGDLDDAERALNNAFDLLSTAGLNADRTTAAVFVNEGVRIWKGEPFEQALAFHYVATLYALRGDWENARAAAANALFRLTDFGAEQSMEELARRAAKDDDYLEDGYTAVDTDFALGFLMQAIGADLSGAAGANEQFDAAIEIKPSLEPLVQTLRSRDYDTLLIVDYGKGPTKTAYGRDKAFVRWVEQEVNEGPLIVADDGGEIARADPVCDVERMADDLKWNNLEDVRKAKSAIGDAMVLGGTFVAASSSESEHQLAGLGLIVAGLLTKSGAQADVRYLEYAPQSIYLVPLRLGETSDVIVRVAGDDGSTMVMPNVRPGSPGKPEAIYLRLHGLDGPDPAWLTAREPLYGNDYTGVRDDDWPWILGGADVSTPSRATLDAYQENGFLLDMTIAGLLEMYSVEDILIGSGMESRPDRQRNPSFRHVLEGGTGLFTPRPHSMGYKRIMFQAHPPYRPGSELVRNAADRAGVNVEELAQEIMR